MLKTKEIPVIDLFAGPGGLGEGFSSIFHKQKRVFEIKLSIEKDENAHKTLELRSFYRKFKKENVPDEYYDVLKEKDLKKREDLILKLFKRYSKEAIIAKGETWRAELGSDEFSSSVIDFQIKKVLKENKDWLLIGGPPCQAYSLVGRSRVGGIDESDHRVYLYKEYLRIIAVHHPVVFVMENVKGLLSAKINKEKVFNWILRDLQDPHTVFSKSSAPKYKIYSLSSKPEGIDIFGKPIYKDNRNFLIQSERFGVPQKRHRVILLGIREDIDVIPEILTPSFNEVSLKGVIGDLPKLRSRLGRSIVSSKTIKGKKKRVYKKEPDTNENWNEIINNFKKEIFNWNGFYSKYKVNNIRCSSYGLGSEYISYKTPAINNPLREWFEDKSIKGVCNHQSRSHLIEDLKRYLFASIYAKIHNRFPRLKDYKEYCDELMPDHSSANSGKFADRFRVQMPNDPASTITSHISKDGHYYIHYDSDQCRSLTVREAARIQTFPDNYLFLGSRTAQYQQVGNAVPPYLSKQIAEIVKSIFEKI